MKRASRGYIGVITSLFDTMLVLHQDEEPYIHPTTVSLPSKITSSPSLSPQHTSINSPSTSQPPNIQTIPVADKPAPMPHDSPLQVKTSKATRKVRIVTSEDEDEEDPSKQGRSLIEELDMDVGISLVPPHATDQGKSDDT
nr:hypothetical protein [Tanacetum cinerariifolium]